MLNVDYQNVSIINIGGSSRSPSRQPSHTTIQEAKSEADSTVVEIGGSESEEPNEPASVTFVIQSVLKQILVSSSNGVRDFVSGTATNRPICYDIQRATRSFSHLEVRPGCCWCCQTLTLAAHRWLLVRKRHDARDLQQNKQTHLRCLRYLSVLLLTSCCASVRLRFPFFALPLSSRFFFHVYLHSVLCVSSYLSLRLCQLIPRERRPSALSSNGFPVLRASFLLGEATARSPSCMLHTRTSSTWRSKRQSLRTGASPRPRLQHPTRWLSGTSQK